MVWYEDPSVFISLTSIIVLIIMGYRYNSILSLFIALFIMLVLYGLEIINDVVLFVLSLAIIPPFIKALRK